MTNKELEKKVEELERMIKKYFETPMKGEKQLTIDDIEVGQQFKYCGHTYTKLNEENFCIIDDYDKMFMRCQFDLSTNNYDKSIIRNYLNSDRFIERLGVNREDIKPHYKEDLLTLLSKEEYEEYRDLIKDYDCWWDTRSASSGYSSTFCVINNDGNIKNDIVHYTYGVRLGFNLNPNTPVNRRSTMKKEWGMMKNDSRV